MKRYFDSINREVEKAYNICNKARAKGFDPIDEVEIPIAKDMTERVEGLISAVAPQIKNSGMVERINKLEEIYSKLDWRVAFKIAEEVAQQKFCKFENKLEAMEVGIRVGIAYVTNGVVASPLEGFTNLKIKKRKDGKEYIAAFFSGPIRSAGGTGASVSFLIADYVRKIMNYEKYDPTHEEIKRASTELRDYHERVTNLQYFPSEEETEFFYKNLPIQLDGDPSEKFEVSNYKDLSRIETNRIRSGFCLVLGEGLTSKAPKLWGRLSQWGKDFGMDHWNFLPDFLKLQKNIRAKEEVGSGDELIKKDYTFIKDLAAGRPILTHPLEKGGFRLRYGRCRNSGLSSMAIHPATMVVLKDYIAVGTQLKVERPSKGTALGVCDTIEGPIVKLKNGDVLFLDNPDEARKVLDKIEEILFLGDILVSYGDFFNRNHVLVQPGYCEEWWIQELKHVGKNIESISNLTDINVDFIKKLIDEPTKVKVSLKDSYVISKKMNIPLHPRYTYHWKDIDYGDFFNLIKWLRTAKIEDDKIVLLINFNLEKDPKRILELLGIPHKVVIKENVIIENDWADALKVSLGFYENKKFDFDKTVKFIEKNKSVLDIINKISEVRLEDKSGICIGARMGRPEKAKMRKLTGSPHILFPVGEEGGRLRSFQSSIDYGYVTAELSNYYCENCDNFSIYKICEKCGKKTNLKYWCNECNKFLDNKKCDSHGELKPFTKKKIDINYYINAAKKSINVNQIPNLIKGVRGTSNEDHNPENFAKGILRALNNIYVNKDGTVRYDMTELVITHFKPREVGTSVEKLKELGYDKDIHGNGIVNDDQIIELKVQDVILPACPISPDEGADSVLFRIANFIDALLKDFYKVGTYYNLKNKKDLIGHLILGLAPHTSAAIVGRIVGFSETQGCYANPLWHCAIRRDADGDECAIFLLLDGLLNFSRKYLPTHRGARQDAPLVLTSNLIPSEVDDMVFDMDIAWEYPLEFYEACKKNMMPREFKIEQVVDRLGKENQFFGWGFTHDVSNINNAVVCSAYKLLPTMMEKVRGQMEIAEKIRAVDEEDVAKLVIEKHFIRDIKGNLRKFSMQQFRCVNCNEKFRRPPLSGVCLKCGGKIMFTISEGSIIKYLKPSLELANKYSLPSYVQQTLELTKKRIESVFGKEKEKQEGLIKWF